LIGSSRPATRKNQSSAQKKEDNKSRKLHRAGFAETITLSVF
jgi:hypothetical protein